jgi:hypothetical protein
MGDPVAGVVAEAHLGEVDELAAIGVSLGLALGAPGVVQGPGASPALAPLDAVGVHAGVSAAVHAGDPCLLGLGLCALRGGGGHLGSLRGLAETSRR